MSDSLGEGFRQVYERLKMEFYREVFCASHDVDASLSAVEAFSLAQGAASNPFRR